MQSYESVSNVFVTPDIPSVTINVGGTPVPYPMVPARSVGAPVTRYYEPYAEHLELYDPSKGRNFKSLKKSGAILFSPYTHALTVQKDYVSSCNHSERKFYQIRADALSTPPTCYVGPVIPMERIWTQNEDFSSLSKRLSLNGKPREAFDGDVLDAISLTQQGAFDQALNAYDLLTELAEMKETTSYLFSKIEGGAALMQKFADKDQKTYAVARRLNAKALMRHGDVAFRALGKRWMEYRYALMPLFYSFEDIRALLSERAYSYKSDRSRIAIDVNHQAPLDSYESLNVDSSGEILVRSLTKGRFTAGDMQKVITALGLNPFRTAWELIPLSFTVDWFLNIGEAITSTTGIDYATERAGVTSVKESTVFTYTHMNRVVWNYTQKGKTNLCGAVIPDQTATFDQSNANVVREVIRNSYVRTLWKRPEPKIIFNPFLNWKRFIDASVLTYQPTKKILRSLK